MKKIFVFAALASLVFASCSKSSTNVEQFTKADGVEVGIMPFASVMTRGYVIAGDSFTDGGTERTMQVSGFRVSAKDSADFFIDQTFAKGATVSGTPASAWVANPPVFYPLGSGDIYKFLAFSDNGVCDAEWDGAKKVVLNVDSASVKQDIVASAFKNDTKNQTANAKFHHTQSYITLSVAAKDAPTASSNLTINSLSLKNVYNIGKLTLAYADSAAGNSNKPAVKWSFFGMCKCETYAMPNGTFDDTGKFVENTSDGYGKAITTTPAKYEGLYPANQKPSAVVISYTLNGSDMEAVWDLTTTTYSGFPEWVSGKHYTYNITIGMYEVTITPTVEDYAPEIVSPTIDIV